MSQADVTGYRNLSDAEVAAMNEIKRHAASIGELVESLSADQSADQRCVSIARTNLQTGFMWLNRAIAQPQSFG